VASEVTGIDGREAITGTQIGFLAMSVDIVVQPKDL